MPQQYLKMDNKEIVRISDNVKALFFFKDNLLNLEPTYTFIQKY